MIRLLVLGIIWSLEFIFCIFLLALSLIIGKDFHNVYVEAMNIKVNRFPNESNNGFRYAYPLTFLISKIF